LKIACLLDRVQLNYIEQGVIPVRKYVIQYLTFPFVLLIFCSCAWWGAETTIVTSAGFEATGSILNIIESELQLDGHSIHLKNDKKGVIETEWLEPDKIQRHEDFPDKACRYKLRFQSLSQNQQIVVAVRYQEYQRGTATHTIGVGEMNRPVPGRSGWYTLTYEPGNLEAVHRIYEMWNGWGEAGGLTEKDQQYKFKRALWDDCQPDWIIDPIEDLLYRVIRRIGADSELSWVLVKLPELSGPRYRGPLPRKKN